MGRELEDLKRLADNLGKLLGRGCEIVIHDLSGDCDSTIVHIVNGELSGREIGGCPSSLFFEHAPDLSGHEEELSVYFNETGGQIDKVIHDLPAGRDGKHRGCGLHQSGRKPLAGVVSRSRAVSQCAEKLAAAPAARGLSGTFRS